jgi:hypothetical protein
LTTTSFQEGLHDLVAANLCPVHLADSRCPPEVLKVIVFWRRGHQEGKVRPWDVEVKGYGLPCRGAKVDMGFVDYGAGVESFRA